MSAELKSLFAFTAYPGATLLTEHVYGGNNQGPFTWPANLGYREYRSADSVAQIQAYYQKLASDNGWALSSSYVDARQYGGPVLARLQFARERFNATVSVSTVPLGSYGPGYPVAPAAAPSSVPSESATPVESPTPQPTPSGPYIVHVDGEVRSF
jgi:hypothetical protein